MKSIWDFIQNQILGMQWLNDIISKLLVLIGLDVEGKIGGSIRFLFMIQLKLWYCSGF